MVQRKNLRLALMNNLKYQRKNRLERTSANHFNKK